jgi:hypothetical protein
MAGTPKPDGGRRDGFRAARGAACAAGFRRPMGVRLTELAPDRIGGDGESADRSLAIMNPA